MTNGELLDLLRTHSRDYRVLVVDLRKEDRLPVITVRKVDDRKTGTPELVIEVES